MSKVTKDSGKRRNEKEKVELNESILEVVSEENQEEKEDASDAPTDNPLKEELEEAKDKYLRLYSEFENFRRRTSKEKIELISTANKDLIADLVPVLDDFDRAITASNSNNDFKTLKEGIVLVNSKLNKTLELKGLKKMKVEKGDSFDDTLHEAVTQIPSEEDLEGKIVDVIEAGYTLGEKIVRFAKVVVGSKK